MPDWRDTLLAALRPAWEPGVLTAPQDWPGYQPRAAVKVLRGPLAGHEVAAAVWDFTVLGGSFGEGDATALTAAADLAVAAGLPLVTWLRSGGTRLQEGMAALVGIPRARLALQRLAGAGLAHLAVCDEPTTGGVWIAMGSVADLRCGVAGATVGFAGPRVVRAVTGREVPPGSHTAQSAYDGGLLDAVCPPEGVEGWLARALDALTAMGCSAPGSFAPGSFAPGSFAPGSFAPGAHQDAGRGGAEQVAVTRARTLSGSALLAALLADPVDLRAGDGSVRAAVGRLGGPTGPGTVVVALAAELGGAPTPAGYALLTRAAGLAGRLGLGLVTLVDTPGAACDAAAEQAGIAPAIAAGMDAVLACPSPVIALVHGEGGSGGALAATVGDRVLVSPGAYFAPLVPEGAAAALRVAVATAADQMGITPGDLLRLGVADALVPASTASTAPVAAVAAVAAVGDLVPTTDATAASDAGDLAGLLVGELHALAAEPPADRLASRRERWAGQVPSRR